MIYHGVVMVGCVGFCVAAAFAYMTWKATQNRVEPIAPDGKIHSLDVISLQIDILGLTMAAVGIGLGVVGFFGYQSIRTAAEESAGKAAEQVARKIATDLVPTLVRQGGVPDPNGHGRVGETPLANGVTVEKEG